MTRAVLISLLLLASAVIGGAVSPSDAKSAPSCPYEMVCLWSASNFQGSKLIIRPVPSGQCRKIADIGSGWSSVYNRTHRYVRVWESTYEHANGGTRCDGSANLIHPRQARKTFSFGPARGLGGY